MELIFEVWIDQGQPMLMWPVGEARNGAIRFLSVSFIFNVCMVPNKLNERRKWQVIVHIDSRSGCSVVRMERQGSYRACYKCNTKRVGMTLCLRTGGKKREISF